MDHGSGSASKKRSVSVVLYNVDGQPQPPRMLSNKPYHQEIVKQATMGKENFARLVMVNLLKIEGVIPAVAQVNCVVVVVRGSPMYLFFLLFLRIRSLGNISKTRSQRLTKI